jgi:hypothetical protein
VPKEENDEKDKGKNIVPHVAKIEEADDEEIIGDVVVTNILSLT